VTERWTFRQYPEYKIDIEEAPGYLIFHMPNCARVRFKRMRADLFALNILAANTHSRVACAIPVDNKPVQRLVRALGMIEAPEHHDVPNEGAFAVFFLPRE